MMIELRTVRAMGASRWFAVAYHRGDDGKLFMQVRDPHGRRDLLTWCQLRAPSKKVARACCGCGTALAAGDTGYRPVGDGMHRMDRFCVPCVEAAVEDVPNPPGEP